MGQEHSQGKSGNFRIEIEREPWSNSRNIFAVQHIVNYSIWHSM